jgi:hypothetical protein
MTLDRLLEEKALNGNVLTPVKHKSLIEETKTNNVGAGLMDDTHLKVPNMFD